MFSSGTGCVKEPVSAVAMMGFDVLMMAAYGLLNG